MVVLHHKGVAEGRATPHRAGTTRALSLVVSGAEKVRRPWYSGKFAGEDPDTLVVRAEAGVSESLVALLGLPAVRSLGDDT